MAFPQRCSYTVSRRALYLITVLNFLLILQLSSTAYGQFGGSGPLAVGVRYDDYDPGRASQIIGSYSRPSFRPIGRVTLLGLEGGYRFYSQGDSNDVRWRINVLEADMRRNSVLLGVTLFDFNKAGDRDEEYRWFQFRAGPAYTLGARQYSITPYAIGLLGRTTTILGNTNYGAFDSLATEKYAGLNFGYQVGGVISIGPRARLSAGFEQTTLLDGPEPDFRTLQAEGRFRVGNLRGTHAALWARYSREDSELNNGAKVENTFLRAGVEVLFMRARPKGNPWDDYDD